MATCDLWAGAWSCKSRTQRVSFPCLLQFPGVAASIRLHNMHHLSCDLAQDNHWLSQKDWGHHLPWWMIPLKFLRRGWARVLPLFVLHFWLWVKVNPCLILDYNLLDKIAGIIFIARPSRYLEISSWVLFWSSVNIRSTHPAQTFDIPRRCWLGLIVLSQNLCPLRYLCFTGLASYHT